MNCKSLLAIAAVAATGASLAVESSTTLCRIRVDSTTRETIIGLPLVNVGGTDQSIAVTNFVLTSGLPAGTTLSYKASDGTWYNWQKEGASDQAWTAAMGDELPVDNFTRGGAVLVSQPSSAAPIAPIYLYGQIDTAQKTFTPVSGTSSSPAYTLMGNAGTSDFALNTTGIWTATGSPSNGDQIIIPVMKTFNIGSDEVTMQTMRTYVWSNNAWHKGAEQEATEDTIAAGQGFWYVSKGSTVPTVAW